MKKLTKVKPYDFAIFSIFKERLCYNQEGVLPFSGVDFKRVCYFYTVAGFMP